jgi:predicted amidohydrolase
MRPESSGAVKLKIACVQMRARSAEHRGEALQSALRMIDAAADGGAKMALLPETFYPSYYLGGIDPAWSWREAFSALSEKAAERRIFLAAGIVLKDGGSLRNAAVLWGPDGKERLRTYKSNLWHFDERYVEPGLSFDVAETPWGPVGMMICADGRIPEIARILAMKGARLILDPTNLVASGRDPSRLSSPQLEYMLCARAAENGLWIAVANKVGLESESVLNCGGSCVVDPYGEKVASLGSAEEGILFVDVDLDAAPYALPARAPQKYGAIAQKKENTRAFQSLSEPLPPLAEDELFLGVAQFSYEGTDDYMNRAARMLTRSADQGASLVCLPGTPSCSGDEIAAALSSSLAGEKCMAACAVAEPGAAERRLVLFDSNGLVASLHEGRYTPVETSAGRIGVVFGDEGWNPEPVRCLMLEGAEIVLWYGAFEDERRRSIIEKIARTRASENRVCIVGSFSGPVRESCIIPPSGAVAASALPGESQAVFALVRRSDCRWKTVMPGTDIAAGRHTEAYLPLTETRPF